MDRPAVDGLELGGSSESSSPDDSRMGAPTKDNAERNGLTTAETEVRGQSKGIRQDIILWLSGMLFIIALLGTMFGLGQLRGWDAKSGYNHNESESSQERFMPEPFTPEPGVPERDDPYAAGRWYYWQLPTDQATALTRLFVWLCYIGHQLTIWGTIFYAQKKKSNREFPGPKYSSNVYSIQWVPLLLNIFFHVMHLLQTHTTYDAMAQDVTEASSQGSVIMLLVLVLLMEYRDRGLAFGWPTLANKDKVSKALRFSPGPINMVRKYHGYAFSWAAIYTFWYHPMENTWGHALGFTHTWMIMLQGSLMYTNLHLNRLWRLTLEAWVVVHGTVVALQTGGPDLNGTLLWPMFCFGFLWLFSMTQIFGFSFWKKLPWWTRFFPFLLYLGLCVGCYSQIPDRDGNFYVRLPGEIVRIPAIEYMSLIYAWGLLEVFIRIEKKLSSKKSDSEKSAPLSPAWETFYILCFILTYVALVTLSYLLQQLDAKQDLIVLMSVLIIVFIFGAAVSFMMIDPIMKGNKANFKVMPKPTSEGEKGNSYGTVGQDGGGKDEKGDEGEMGGDGKEDGVGGKGNEGYVDSGM